MQLNYQQKEDSLGCMRSGKVVLKMEDAYLVEGDRPIKARRAYSCHLVPDIGDTVLLAETEDQTYILAVLARDMPDMPHEYYYPGNSVFKMDGFLCQQASHIQLSASSYKLQCNHSKTQSGRVEVEATSVHTKADVVDTEARAMQLRLERLYQWVSNFEQHWSQRLRMLVKEHFRVDTKASVFVSEEDTKIRARQVHLG